MATVLDYDRKEKRGVSPWPWVALGLAFVLLTTCLVPKFTSSPGLVPAARADIGNIRIALDAFKSDTGRYPTYTEGLDALIKPPAGLANWHGPYLMHRLPSDPWGNPHAYVPPTGSAPPRVVSGGADRKAGTADDIASP